MTVAIGDYIRRNVRIALCDKQAAESLCNAIEAAANAAAFLDDFAIFPIAASNINEATTDPLDLGSIPGTVTLQNVKLISLGDFAGVDATHTIHVSLADGDGNVIASKTYNNSTAPVNKGGDSLGALNATYKVLADENLLLSFAVSDGVTLPDLLLQIRYRYMG